MNRGASAGSILKWGLLACLVAVAAPLAVMHGLLRASLPPLDGEIVPGPGAHGPRAPISIERDDLGVPTITAADRLDLAYGTGFVHGQDRFFQMDLARRFAAGELAELLGPPALGADQRARLFRFRRVARSVLAQATPVQRALLAAYVRGVNAGLASLRSRPWEYWLLRSRPVPWREEDTILAVYSIWWALQYQDFESVRVRRELDAALPGARCASGWKCALEFLSPARSDWDSPLDGPDGSPPEGRPARATLPADLELRTAPGVSPPEQRPHAGSNAWAVAGRLTATHAALVANDMHLDLRVPPIWYRARLRTGGGSAAALDLNGVTLPGAPILVVGSNGKVAWGFTHSAGSWLDLTPLACTAVGESRLATPTGSVPLTTVTEWIRVRGAAPVRFEVATGPDGVLYDAHPEKGRCWFAQWLAMAPEATNLNLLGMETASSVDEALALAAGVGIPALNAVLGDSAGHIAWTIFGRIPEATGPGRASGRGRWLDLQAQPRIVDPEAGLVWSANARASDAHNFEAAIGGDAAALGAEYDLAARAHQIHGDLLALAHPATPADMLGIQLDDRAQFLARWRGLALQLLDADAVRGRAERAQFRRLVADWDARASVAAVGYRLVRGWRSVTQQSIWSSILENYGVAGVAVPPPAQFEQPLWELVTTRPPRMLAPPYASWREFLLAQVDATIGQLKSTCGALARCTWGARQPVRIAHPLSAAAPLLAPFIDLPALELPGDSNMPRVQEGAFGASERFAVSPGHEAQGYLELPGGQSAHPLSPYYRAGLQAWAQGEATPLLPGPARHHLVVLPSR